MGELARAQNVPARARDHYLDALALSGGPTPLRQRAMEALAAIQAGTGNAAGFDAGSRRSSRGAATIGKRLH
jgi:hypothetical protein